MDKKLLEDAITQFAHALTSQTPDLFFNDPKLFVAKIPKRSLSGDHINGGKIVNFASNGINDRASTTQIDISDAGATIEHLRVSKILGSVDVEDSIKVKEIISDKIKTSVIEADSIVGEIKFEKNQPISFGGDTLYGKGLLWPGQGYTKQFIFNGSPDRFFSSESIDLAKDKFLSVNNVKIIDAKEIGPTVTKSNLREVGRLRGLIVDGSMSINSFIYFNGDSNRLGFGTEQPNAAVSVVESNIEMMLGTKDNSKGLIGTFATHGLDIVTDNTARISVSPGGNIFLGNPKTPPAQVTVYGKLAIKVNTPDPEVDLHVNGAVKFDGRTQRYAKTFPTLGIHNIGDIVWNSEPKTSSYVGWICTKSGNPGVWEPFGKIGNQ
jgi:hypothetical protein